MRFFNWAKKYNKLIIGILVTCLIVICSYTFFVVRTTRGSFNSMTQILECLYYIVGVCAFIALVNGSRQNKLLAEEINNSKQVAEDTFKRETANLTVQRCKEYADEIIPRIAEITIKLRRDNKYQYNRNLKIEDFNDKHKYEEYNANEVFENKDTFKYCIQSANALEAYSMYFTQKICDNEIAYSAISETFISLVNYLYPFILRYRVLYRSNGYSNVVKLYEIWISKADEEKIAGAQSELENLQESINRQRNDLEKEKKEKMCKEDLTPIGLKKR